LTPTPAVVSGAARRGDAGSGEARQGKGER